MEFAREKATSAFFEELVPLIHKHHDEIYRFKDLKLDPQYDLYTEMDRQGILRVFTARDDARDGELVGYSFFTVCRYPHYMGSMFANEEVLFLAKQYRKGLGGFKFMRWIEGELDKESIDVIKRTTTTDFDFGVLFERMGYKRTEIIYSRRGT